MKKIMMAIACLMILAGVSWADDMENANTEAKYYENAKVVRIKNIEGEGFVQRSYDEGYEEATPNLPLFEKDTVGTTAGRLGIYLGRLNYLRLDTDTTIQLLGVPQLRRTDLVARVEKGAIYLDIENLDNEKGVEIQTPDCGVFLLDKGIYRVNVDENSLTEIFVIEGIAEVAGQSGSRNVRENQKIVMVRGQIEERPYYFYASEKDDFDRWNESQNREQGYARYGTSRYLQSGYEDYEYEMSRSGHWTFMSEFNSYVWAPYYSNADWMPYGNGRWVYNPFYGYVWVSYDQCGWFTHHYGRWQWSYGSGWYWIPSYHWSPAWVSWFWDNDYYGWSPLSWWNRPVVIINNRWDRHYDYRRGIPSHSRSTIIIRKNELTAINAAQAALRRGNIGSTGSRLLAYHGAAPSERPSLAQISVVNARGRTVAYKQNGIISKEKYRISNEAAESGKSAVYRYNNSGDTGSKYSPRVYRKKDEDKSSDTTSGRTYRSTTSKESSSSSKESTRSRATKRDDSSSSNQSSSSDNAARTRGQATTSSQSSSSTDSEAREAKKKKDQAAYMALLRSENTAGYKSHATGIASNSSQYDPGVSDTNRFAYRSYESRTGSASGDFATQRKSSRYTGSSTANMAALGYRPNGYSYPSAYATDSTARARSSSRAFSSEYASGRGSASGSSHNSGSGSSDRVRASGFASSSSASSSHSSHASVSAPTHSWSGSSSHSSHSSSGSTFRAKKK